jgi:hypothetical protein
VPDPLAVSPAGLYIASATLNEHAQTELSLKGDAARYRRPAEGRLPKTRRRLLLLQIEVDVETPRMVCSVKVSMASVNTGRRYLVTNTRCACSNDTLWRAGR